MERLFSLAGIVAILGIAYALSADRKAIQRRTVAWGLGLQVALALFVLKTAAGQAIFGWLGDKIAMLLALSYKGSEFVFGPLLGAPGGGASKVVVFAFQVLPTIIYVSALFAMLYHLGVMQPIVAMFARVMTRLMGTSGAESLNASAGIFMGQTEAPLTIRPYLGAMTESELLCVMTSGMAHISAGIMGVYIQQGLDGRYLLASVLMTAPGSILLAKLLLPETGKPQTAGSVRYEVTRTDPNLVGAAARGTSEGLSLALNVAAMLISFLALIGLVNLLLGLFGLTLETILGYVFAPVALLMGVPFQDIRAVGSLLGTRMVTNEFIAYYALLPQRAALDPRSFAIATFALCGFANLGSIGIQIGGIGALIPERKGDLARLGFRALIAGTLANFLTACIAGALL